MLKRQVTLLMMLVFLSACVTINIYFPTAKAEEAAEKIVDDILKSGPAPNIKQAPARDDTQSTLDGRRIIGALLDLLVAPAHAAQPNFNVDSPEIRAVQASLKARHPSLVPYYNSGALGFAEDARLAVHDAGAVSLKERSRMNQLMQEENADRDKLYRAIAKANGQPQWEKDVRSVFAETWVKKANAGWWYRQGGQWQRK